MREIPTGLLNAQQASSIDVRLKIELTHGTSSYTYDQTRILDINHPEEPYTQTCDIVLANADKALNSLAFPCLLGLSQYGDLHLGLGHTLGLRGVRGIQVCPHRRHVKCGNSY